MAENEVYLDVTAISSIVDQFRMISETLVGINQNLETVVNILVSYVFTKNPGIVISEEYADRVKPLLLALIEKSYEMNRGIENAIITYQQSDIRSSKEFG